MSDLSWLNPTPHAIAVYASSPLSPAATQHSLPSGRYPLLGPDFHRLDRTSLRLAHSLDHLVGHHEQRVQHVDHILTRRRDRLHSAVPNWLGSARGGKKFDQSFRTLKVSRADHDGG